MITGQYAIILNLVMIAILVFIVSNVCLTVMHLFIHHRYQQFSLRSRKWLLWLQVTFPWIVAILAIALFSTLFSTNMADSELNQFTHWHHEQSFYFSSWHGVVLISFLILMAVILSKKVIALVKHLLKVRSLHLFAEYQQEGYFRLQSQQLTAFTVGLFRPRCFLSSALEQKVSEEQKQIILAHEQAHITHRDPLKKWCFSALAAFFIPSIRLKLLTQMTIAMEQSADNKVIQNNFEKTQIASTLIKVAREAGNQSLNSTEHAVCFDTQVITQRVHYLLDMAPSKDIPPWILLLPFGVISYFTAMSIDVLHHLVETVLSH